MKQINNNILYYDRIGDSIQVSFKDTRRLSIINSGQIEKELLDFIKRGETSIFLDFSIIDFIDTSGFQALISVLIDSKLNNIEFIIINVSKEVRKLFNLVKLDKLFDIRNESDPDFFTLRKVS